jgi:hypothetical protein
MATLVAPTPVLHAHPARSPAAWLGALYFAANNFLFFGLLAAVGALKLALAPFLRPRQAQADTAKACPGPAGQPSCMDCRPISRDTTGR